MRKEYWRERREAIDRMHGFLNLTPEEMVRWRELSKQVLDAKEALSDYEESLMKAPLDPEKREKLFKENLSEYISVTTGDGMDADRAEAELREMSDLKFLFCVNNPEFSDEEEL